MSAVLQLAGCGMVHGMDRKAPNLPMHCRLARAHRQKRARMESRTPVHATAHLAEGEGGMAKFSKTHGSVSHLPIDSAQDRQADHG